MFNRNRSKKTLLTQSSFPNIQGERSSKHGKKKHYLTHEFDVLFTKINNIREWTKNLIKDSMAIVSLEVEMNVKGYLDDSEKKHLGKTKLEILGVDMINAAKGSGIKGGTYEKALIKVGECERRLGTYGRDYVVDVCSSFIRPLKYFLDVELNKLVEEKEMLTSRKIDFDYHVKQMNSGKIDKNGLHKLKMAEMALEFQYIHAKEVLQEIEASECQVGHLSDLISVQSVYHQKCLAELEKLKTDLQKMSSNTGSEKKSSKASSSARKSVHKRKLAETDVPGGTPSPLTRMLSNVDKDAAKSQDLSNKLEPQISQDQFQSRDNERTDQRDLRKSGKPPDMRSAADKKCNQRNGECPMKDSQRCKTTRRSPPEDKSPVVENITDTSEKDLLHEPPNKECCNTAKRSVKNVSSPSSYSRPHVKSSCHHRVGDQSPGSPNTEEFSTDDSTSKETHVIPIPVRSDYRREVGKIYFTPRQDLE